MRLQFHHFTSANYAILFSTDDVGAGGELRSVEVLDRETLTNVLVHAGDHATRQVHDLEADIAGFLGLQTYTNRVGVGLVRQER